MLSTDIEGLRASLVEIYGDNDPPPLIERLQDHLRDLASRAAILERQVVPHEARTDLLNSQGKVVDLGQFRGSRS